MSPRARVKVSDMSKALIQSDPRILAGKPVVAGTRITVELSLEKLAAGESIEQILTAHPKLTREAVQAALAFAANALKADVVYPIEMERSPWWLLEPSEYGAIRHNEKHSGR